VSAHPPGRFGGRVAVITRRWAAVVTLAERSGPVDVLVSNAFTVDVAPAGGARPHVAFTGVAARRRQLRGVVTVGSPLIGDAADGGSLEALRERARAMRAAA
jgi:hypothetical protein